MAATRPDLVRRFRTAAAVGLADIFSAEQRPWTVIEQNRRWRRPRQTVAVPRIDIGRPAIEIERRRALQEMIVVANRPPGGHRLPEQIVARAEGDRPGRADGSASRPCTTGATRGAQVAFDRMMIDR
ncbi:MAG: hypothetical protein KDG52_17860, partial [Rhodocyclaceae bacterium]|nr:hypothetical protein [Rhodocyclaceae bacterium]